MEVTIHVGNGVDCYKVEDAERLIIKGADSFEIKKANGVVELTANGKKAEYPDGKYTHRSILLARRGEWIVKAGSLTGRAVCNLCGCEKPMFVERYCPGCGARMTGDYL